MGKATMKDKETVWEHLELNLWCDQCDQHKNKCECEENYDD